MASVEEILRDANEKEPVYKSIEVTKDIDLEIDEGNLLAIDKNPIDLKSFRSKSEDFLRDLVRDDVQLLINSLWRLPMERVEDAVVVELPEPKTLLPREKPIPKQKRPTKWQEYARAKGIQNKKKSRMMWDEEAKEWRPRWGYKKAGDTSKDWLLEVPDNADPMEDQFEKKNKAKREKVAKNELQRLSNLARHMKGKVPGVGLFPSDKPVKEDVNKALHLAKKSTASIGKFTESLPKEKPTKNMGKKRKFEDNLTSINNEKKRALDIVNRIQSKKATLDIVKATNQQLVKEDLERKELNESNFVGEGKKKNKKNSSGKEKKNSKYKGNEEKKNLKHGGNDNKRGKKHFKQNSSGKSNKLKSKKFGDHRGKKSGKSRPK